MVERDLVFDITNWGEVLKIPKLKILPIMTSLLIPGEPYRSFCLLSIHVLIQQSI